MNTEQRNADGDLQHVRCYDQGTDLIADRYTVVYYDPNISKRCCGFPYLHMSAEGFRGFSVSGVARTPLDTLLCYRAPALGQRCHLGQRIPFSALPLPCRLMALEEHQSIYAKTTAR